jgi:hypothetical protein
MFDVIMIFYISLPSWSDIKLCTVHRPGEFRKECEECGNARGSNVRYYPTWKHSPFKDYWLTNAHELLTTEWLKY